MNEEAIKELAQQLGKGVNWVTDTLLPYVYDYAEYKIAIYTICAILFGIIFILGIIFITKAFKIKSSPGYSKWGDDEDKVFALLMIGIPFVIGGFVAGIVLLDSLLAWSIAPEITFIENMTNES